MKSILIVAEYSRILPNLILTAQGKWPEANITAISVDYLSLIRFHVSELISEAAAPALVNPQYSFNWDRGITSALSASPGGEVHEVPFSLGLLRGADTIVFAGDRDNRGVSGFLRLLNHSFAKNLPESLELLIIGDLAETGFEGIDKAFETMLPFHEVFCLEDQAGALIKPYFDWLWHINSQAVFKPELVKAGVEDTSFVLTKNMLQVLYWMKGRELTAGELLKAMENWNPSNEEITLSGALKDYCGMGSPTSRYTLLLQLASAGLLNHCEKKGSPETFSLSLKAEQFLNQLSPECEDPYLPLHLHFWECKGAISLMPINRYIHNYFSKQLEYSFVESSAA